MKTKTGRRVCSNTTKSISSTSKHRINKPKNSAVVAKARKHTMKKLLGQDSSKRIPKSLFSDGSDESEEEDKDIQNKTQHKEIQGLKADLREIEGKYKKLKNKYTLLKSNFQNTFQLNLDLQKELLASRQSTSLPSTSHSSKLPTVPSPLPFPLPELPSPLPELPTVNEPSSSHNTSFVVDFPEQNTPSTPLPSISTIPFYADPTSALPSAFEECNPPSASSNTDFQLDEAKLKMAMFKVRPGVEGDSLFAKNLSLAIFGQAVLMASSVTGRKCNAKGKGNVATKPQLCPERMHYLRELFISRMKKDDVGVSPEEIAKRTQKINSAIAEKIATLVRSRKSPINADF